MDGSPAQSLDAFLATVEKRALRIAQIATRDRDEALDIVQDSMLQLARSYPLRPAAEWPPLFHRILDNKIHDWQRRQAVRNRVFFWRRDAQDEDLEDPVLSVAESNSREPPQCLMQAAAMEKLERALAELPRRQRQAFALRVWEGLSVEDSARAMQCSAGSVKTHLFRALAALRKQLEGIYP